MDQGADYCLNLRCRLRRILPVAATVFACALFPLGQCNLAQAETIRENSAANSMVGSLLMLPSSVYSPNVVQLPPPEGGVQPLHQQLRAAVEEQDVSRAFRIASVILQSKPDDEISRRVLGYERVGDNWGGRVAAQRAQRGNQWDAEFGWVNPENLDRMRGGERPFGRRWISVEEDSQRHAAIRNGWTARTDHVQVLTNHSQQAAAQMAVRVETLYQLWRQLFGDFSVTPQELEARLEGKQALGARRAPFRVVYHRSRDQYNSELRQRQPQIDMTLGIYFDAYKESHFFAGKDQDPGTINHEAVHQFFHESTGARRNVSTTANTWAIEGVACYFESLVRQQVDRGVAEGAEWDGRSDHGPRMQNGVQWYMIGMPGAGRLEAARRRRLVDDYYVPLGELSSLGMADLQQRSDIAPLYSQSAGLAAFFMDYNQGAYRQAFNQLLRAIYAGRDDVDTITKLTGKPFRELDAEYRDFLESLSAPGAASKLPYNGEGR